VVPELAIPFGEVDTLFLLVNKLASVTIPTIACVVKFTKGF